MSSLMKSNNRVKAHLTTNRRPAKRRPRVIKADGPALDLCLAAYRLLDASGVIQFCTPGAKGTSLYKAAMKAQDAFDAICNLIAKHLPDRRRNAVFFAAEDGAAAVAPESLRR
jgi:hypothetical protein